MRSFTNVIAAVLLAGCASHTVESGETIERRETGGALSERESVILAELQAATTNPENNTSMLFWSDEQRRWGFKHAESIYNARPVKAGSSAYELGEAPRNLDGVAYSTETGTYRLSDFIANPAFIGLVVVKNGDVIYERYAPGNDRSSRWISFSVAKSVTSMLIGAAVQDGYIAAADEPVVDHLPRLKGTGYERATVKDVLQMASGVAWNEDYADPNSDVARAGAANGLPLIRYLANQPAAAEPGVKFNYNSGETNLVGEILRSAIGNNAATYLSHKIWQPFGMEADAFWVTDSPGGGELGGCCILATLRDYARIGLFAMNDGVLADGTRVLPEGWMAQSIAPSRGFEGYGYLWWLNSDGSYMARGIFAQHILIDPEADLVIALHGNAPAAVGTDYHVQLEAAVAALRAAVR